MPVSLTPAPRADSQLDSQADFGRAATPQEFAHLMRLPPQDAVAYMQGRERLAVTYNWRELWQPEHARAFTVSRLTQADVLDAVRRGIAQSVAGDLTRKDFVRDAKAVLQKEGWWGEKEVTDPATGEVHTTRFDSRRLGLIFDVNTATAAAAGQWARIQQTKGTFGFLRYLSRDDGRVRPAHQAWHNLVLPVDDAFWHTHYPPNGWRCRCRVVSLRGKDLDRLLQAQQTNPPGDPAMAIKTTAPKVVYKEWLNSHTGQVQRVPEGIDPGWGYNVGQAQAQAQARAKVEAEKLRQLDPSVRAQVLASRKVDMGARADLDKLPPVTVVDVAANPFGLAPGATKGELMQAARVHLRAYQDLQMQDKAPMLNEDTGWEFTVNRLAVKKMADNNNQSLAELGAVSEIAELVRWAKRVETHPDVQHANDHVGAVHRFYVAMSMDGTLYRVKLTVKEYVAGIKAGEMALHALQAIELEEMGGTSPGTLPNRAGFATSDQTTQPTTRRVISLTELIRYAIGGGNGEH